MRLVSFFGSAVTCYERNLYTTPETAARERRFSFCYLGLLGTPIWDFLPFLGKPILSSLFPQFYRHPASFLSTPVLLFFRDGLRL